MRAEDRRKGVKAKLRKSEQREDAHVTDLVSSEGKASVMGYSDGEALRIKIYGTEGAVRVELPDGSSCDTEGRRQPRVRFPDARAVARWGQDLTTLEHEEMWALMLNNANVLKAAKRVSLGGLATTGIDPRAVLRAVLHEGAASFILVHNHPSGSPEPSRDDIETTKRLVQAAKIAGPPLLDHVIVASGGFTSLLDTMPHIFESA
jgi:DNA repair protein RadC